MGWFDCDCACADAPDYSEPAEASEYAADKAYETAAEDLAFRQSVYEDSKPYQQELMRLAEQVAQQQLDIGDTNQQRADEQWQNYISSFQPQERLMSTDALAFSYLDEADQARMLELMQPSQFNQAPELPDDLYGQYENITPATYGPGRVDIPDDEVAANAPAKKIQPINTPNDGLKNKDWLKKYGDRYNRDGTLKQEIYDKYYTREAEVELTPEQREMLDKYSPEEREQILAEYEQALAEFQATEGANRLTREQELAALSQKGQDAAIAQKKAQADALEAQYGLRGDEIQNFFNTEAQTYYDREAARVADDELRAKAAADASINSSYAAQGRDLARRGFNPSRIASAAANIANQQALARIGAANQMYNMSSQRLRGAEDVASNLRQQGGIQGMNTRFAGQDQARQMRDNAKEQTEAKYGSLRAGAAAFGRNMPNTAGQAYGLAVNSGSAAVGNQNTGFQSGLPYAQFVGQGAATGLQAANIGQQGALGMANILSNDYRTAQMGYANMDSGPGLGGVLGAGLQIARFAGFGA